MREWCLVGCAKADTRSFDEPQRSWRRAHALPRNAPDDTGTPCDSRVRTALPAASPRRDTSVGAFARLTGTRASQ
jgi:hypothetical protein